MQDRYKKWTNTVDELFRKDGYSEALAERDVALREVVRLQTLIDEKRKELAANSLLHHDAIAQTTTVIKLRFETSSSRK